MDSSVSETYGEEEGTAYNGHFACTCYHPLFCFNQFGDVEGTLLREGNVHSAQDCAGDFHGTSSTGDEAHAVGLDSVLGER
jgi:hypothetical protein